MLTCFYWCGIKFIAKYETYMSMRACVCVFWYLHNFLNTWKAAACPPDVRASLAGTSQPLQWLEAAAFHFLSLSVFLLSFTTPAVVFDVVALPLFYYYFIYVYSEICYQQRNQVIVIDEAWHKNNYRHQHTHMHLFSTHAIKLFKLLLLLVWYFLAQLLVVVVVGGGGGGGD